MFACMYRLFIPYYIILLLQTGHIPSLGDLDVTTPKVGYCVAVGLKCGCGDTDHPVEYA